MSDSDRYTEVTDGADVDLATLDEMEQARREAGPDVAHEDDEYESVLGSDDR